MHMLYQRTYTQLHAHTQMLLVVLLIPMQPHTHITTPTRVRMRPTITRMRAIAISMAPMTTSTTPIAPPAPLSSPPNAT